MKHITSAGATALIVMGLLATMADAKDNTRHTVQQITAYCNTAKYNECHAAAANNYLACAEDDVNCRCTQLQVLADQCAPLCPQTEVSNAELIRSYCAQSTLQAYASASVSAAASANDVHSNSLMELKKKLKEKLFGKFKGEDPDCPDDKHEDHGDDCPEDKHNDGNKDYSDDVVDDDCHDKCDGDDHHDDCDNKWDDDGDDDDCPEDKYNHDDHHEDDCDEKYDGEDDDCDDECDEYDHNDDCAQYYSYANLSDSPPASASPSSSPQPESDELHPPVQVQSKDFRAMKSAYKKDSADHISVSIPGRFHRRSTIEKLKASGHIVPRSLSLDDPNAHLFRDFLPASLDPDCDEEDDEDCVLDGYSPADYEDANFDLLNDQRASANIIGWPSIPWPWKDDEEQEEDCGDEDKDQWTPPAEEDCGDEDKDQWTPPAEEDCGDEDEWTPPAEDDCGDEDRDQWNAPDKWTPPAEDDCGDEDKEQWTVPSHDEDDCGDDSDKSWDDHSGGDEDDCAEDSDKSPSYDDHRNSKHKVSDGDGDGDEANDDGDDGDGDGDDGDDADSDDADSDDSSDDSAGDGSDSQGKNATEGARQGLRNAIKNVGANIKNATGSGVESSASSVVREGMFEVMVGFAAAAGVGFALL